MRGRLAAGLLALAVAGCKNESVSGPEAGTDYYPLVLGDYRIFAVTDTTWAGYVRQPISRYQLRERVAEQITDAAGLPAYRVVRSRRTLPTDPWRDDSVLVISADAQTVQLTRNNRRTIELIFPVRAARVWNRDALNARDTSSAENRRYLLVGEPVQATANGQLFQYERTVTTDDLEDVQVDDGIRNQAKLRQVYAQGSGPVYRQRRRVSFCPDDPNLPCNPTAGRVIKGIAHAETLIEKGHTP